MNKSESQRPIIGICATPVVDHKDIPPIACVRYSYIRSILDAGGLPLIIPFCEESVRRQYYELTSAILFSGGADVDPSRYGKTRSPHLRETSPERDEAELMVAQWAVAEKKPVLGICRGHQLLNVSLGGTLYQDLLNEFPGTLLSVPSVSESGNSSQRSIHDRSSLLGTGEDIFADGVHTIRIDSQSRLARILQSEEIPVNSVHHQAICDLAPSLRATAWSEDGVIEGFEMNDDRYFLGLQCHPETLAEKQDSRWRQLFISFIDAARDFQSAQI